MNRSVLFLDLATTLGWAEGEPGGRAVSGALRLAKPGATPGMIGKGLMDFLPPRLAAFRPARVVYEMPFIAGIANANTTMVTWGLAFEVEMICEVYGVQCAKANLSTIRKSVLGHVPRGKGVDVKGIVIAHVRSLGYDPADDNEADAICGWIYACSVLDPKASVNSTPLFQD